MNNWNSERYAQLRTFRRDGRAVDTPVWIVAVGADEFGFTTDPTSGKVKRIRNNSRVELAPCSMRGVVAAGAGRDVAEARIVGGGTEYDSVVAALKKKYGLQVWLIEFGGRIKQLIKRNPSPDCAVIVRLVQD